MNRWKILALILVTGFIVSTLLSFYVIPNLFEGHQAILTPRSSYFKEYEKDFVVDESKNKLAVVIKKNGIYDVPEIKEKLEGFLQAVEEDLNIENVGICRSNATSLDELDTFIENLYYEKDVGYIIMVGEDLLWVEDQGWWQVYKSPGNGFYTINDELCFLEAREPDETVEEYDGYYPNKIKDIAISWVIAPRVHLLNITAEVKVKRDFISNVISTYTWYHSNPQVVLNQFSRSYLYICDPTLICPSIEFEFDGVVLNNTEHERILEELRERHLLLIYHVHGAWNRAEMGLNETQIVTTVDDFSKFVEEDGLPSLFVFGLACHAMDPQPSFIREGENYCWSQMYLKNGVWAYFSGLEKAFSTDSFIGYTLRHHRNHIMIYGDITAHMI